jgi:3-hydroxybutyryl-CoA dehydrogenase
VAEGRLGRKTGWGFYRYEGDGRRRAAGASDGARGRDGRAGGVSSAIAERVRIAIAAEACRAAADGIAPTGDIDLAMRLGASHPAGPFEWIEANGGRRELDRRLDALAGLGPRFAPVGGP